MERCEERMLLSTALVSVDAAGTAAGNSDSDFDSHVVLGAPQLGGPSQSPKSNLSADGTRLVFVSEATDLVGALDDTNHASDVFVRDTTTGQTTLVSATPAGQTGNGASFDPVISPNGRYVAFLSQATNLTVHAVPADARTDHRRRQPDGSVSLRPRPPDADDDAAGPDARRRQASDGFSTGQFVFSPDSQSLALIDTSDNLTGAAGRSPAPAPARLRA